MHFWIVDCFLCLFLRCLEVEQRIPLRAEKKAHRHGVVRPAAELAALGSDAGRREARDAREVPRAISHLSLTK